MRSGHCAWLPAQPCARYGERSCCGVAVLTSDIRTVAETGSTNADLIATCARGEGHEGLWLRAGRQTDGRGRSGRRWESDEGNLHCSTIVRLMPRDPAPPSLALVAAISVHDALRHLTPDVAAMLKWPNDVFVGGSKLCGMLLERSGDFVVIGIGVNITHAPAILDRPATSMRQLGCENIDAAMLLNALTVAFARWVEVWRTYGLGPTISAWMERAHPIGTALRAELPDGSRLDGRYDGLDESGALLLRLSDGSRHTIHAGDIFLK